MNITRNDLNTLSAEIVIELRKEDYEPAINEGIKKVQRQASMPGFRPGKVPAGLIRKQYGNQIMADELNKLLNDTIHKYIEENKIDILGNPLPKEEANVDINDLSDKRFVYELGLAPEFSVALDKSINLNYKTVKVDDSLVDKYVNDVRRNYGTPVYPEKSGENDTLFVDVNELEENGEIKAGGIYKSTSFTVSKVGNSVAAEKLTNLAKGDKVVVNVDDLYATDLDKSVGLGIDRELAEATHCNLQLTVKNISRLEEAPLDQTLFNRVYGDGSVDSEEAFREKIRGELGLMFSADADRLFMREVEQVFVGKHNLTLPDDFLKRWIMVANDKPVSMEQVEKDYPEYAKSMQWRLIENKIIKDNQLEVSADELRAEAEAFIRSEYARYGQVPTDEDVQKITVDLMKNNKEAQKMYESLFSRKVLALVKENCTLTPVEVSYDEFFAR